MLKKTTNNKKIAVALEYKPQTEGDAPLIVAKGEESRATAIIQLAKKNDIKIEKNKDLAQLLYLAEVGDFIPPEAFLAVAQILKYIYDLDKKKIKTD